ncbi:MAG: histidine phosphatase family protein [Dehalococcoidia bacterium]
MRHAMPDVEPGVASKLWGLGEAGREDCVLLAHALPEGVSSIWSSDERKAKETADVIGLRLGLPVSTDERFAEVDRPSVWDRDYREVAAGYLSGRDEPGWEARASVVSRFSEAIDFAGQSSELPVVVSHGLATTLWLASRTGINSEPWWRELTLPDAWQIDTTTGELSHLWMGGTRGD